MHSIFYFSEVRSKKWRHLANDKHSISTRWHRLRAVSCGRYL